MVREDVDLEPLSDLFQIDYTVIRPRMIFHDLTESGVSIHSEMFQALG